MSVETLCIMSFMKQSWCRDSLLRRALSACLRTVPFQIVTDAFKKYVSRREKNIPLLSEYAHKLRVEERLRAYLEVLL